MEKLLSRLMWVPYGFILSVIELVNNKTRDLANKHRYPKAIIDTGCTFSSDTTIGINSHILKNTTINFSRVGSYTYISRNTFIQYANIGNYCSIANDVMIGLGSHPLHMFSTSPIFYKVRNPLKIQLVEKDTCFKEHGFITIGSDVWIGAKAIIMDEIIIGNGAVVAAGAVVTKDIPPYAIVAGVPARIIKYRFPSEVRKEMEETKWWTNTADKVYGNMKKLESICYTSSEFN